MTGELFCGGSSCESSEFCYAVPFKMKRFSSLMIASLPLIIASVSALADPSTNAGPFRFRLPYLATYLGHKDIHSTLAYLNTTPEVLQQASERFRKRGARVLSLTGDQP